MTTTNNNNHNGSHSNNQLHQKTAYGIASLQSSTIFQCHGLSGTGIGKILEETSVRIDWPSSLAVLVTKIITRNSTHVANPSTGGRNKEDQNDSPVLLPTLRPFRPFRDVRWVCMTVQASGCRTGTLRERTREGVWEALATGVVFRSNRRRSRLESRETDHQWNLGKELDRCLALLLL